jgi:catechol 2,3-dioxygenase-like lactoylglutathione lyase family enzyme
MIIKDSHVTIMVKDMDKSISFYESIGFSVKQRWQNYYAMLQAPGIVIGLHPLNEMGAVAGSGNVSLGFTSASFEETKAGLNKAGIKSEERTEEAGDFLHFKDPDGTELYFINPKY